MMSYMRVWIEGWGWGGSGFLLSIKYSNFFIFFDFLCFKLKMVAFPLPVNSPIPHVYTAGLPWSGKKFWKIEIFPGQGKSGNFKFLSGKIRKNEKKPGNFKNFQKSCK